MKYYFRAFRNYAVFDGRASLMEFWSFVLFNIIFSFTAFLLDIILGLEGRGYLQHGIIYEIYTAIVFIPGLAAAVRRLHDLGKNGTFIFIVLIPLIGLVIFFITAAGDGMPGKNKFGEAPPDNKRMRKPAEHTQNIHTEN